VFSPDDDSRATDLSRRMSGGMGRPGSGVRYSDRRRAFGKEIRKYQAVSFAVAESITKLDAARAITPTWPHGLLTKTTPMSAGSSAKPSASPRSPPGKSSTTPCRSWGDRLHGGLPHRTGGLRDTRLGMIWTGTSEIMNLLIQHEYYTNVLDPAYDRRRMENDAMHPGQLRAMLYG
jgi:acyl-CoA dehydrogenase